jgi:uncharacterized membrane protein
MKRIRSIDITRGIVMVIMALDHVREFFHKTAGTSDPTNLKEATVLLFFTRWITHICAPAFVFLAGISAFLSVERNADKRNARLFLLKRGIWLVILEFTVINFALWFDIRFSLFLLEVIGAIGFSFIILSLLTSLKSSTIGMAGIVIITIHGLAALIPVSQNLPLRLSQTIFLQPAMIKLPADRIFYSSYPVIPWLGIMMAGYGLGPVFLKPDQERRRKLLISAIISFSVFLVIRFINVYSDPSPWSVQRSPLFTLLSFVNVTKYPPSLAFTTLFLFMALMVLYLSELWQGKFACILAIYGRVPLFYFVVHLYIIHGGMLVMLLLQGFNFSDLQFGLFKIGFPSHGGGICLAGVYIVWILVTVLLYPASKRYGLIKTKEGALGILRYL